MTQHSEEDFAMDVKGEVLLQLFNKSKLRNGTKMHLEQKFFFIVRFKKLGFSAPLKILPPLPRILLRSWVTLIIVSVLYC